MRNRFLRAASMVGGLFLMFSTGLFAEEAAYQPALYSTFWSLVPPIVAIVLALITKEVYSSLFVGIAVGGIFYGGGNFERTMTHVLKDGLIEVLCRFIQCWDINIPSYIRGYGMSYEHSRWFCCIW